MSMSEPPSGALEGDAEPVSVHPLSKSFAWVDDKRVRDGIGVGLGVFALVLAALDVAVHRHAYIGVDGALGFHAWLGFVAFAGVVLTGWPLRRLLSRAPDYYADEDKG